MVQHKRKRAIVITSAVLIVLAALVGTVMVISALNSDNKDPYKQTDVTTDTESATQPEVKDEPTDEPTTSTKDDTSTDEPNLDPAAVGTIDISPMNITVSYVKGVGGFEYEVMRTPSGTEYVEFRSPDLIGTKCTNDAGPFASILEDPQDAERSTITKSTTVDGTTYGLSLATDTCTSDSDALASYQKSFSDAFSLLKKME